MNQMCNCISMCVLSFICTIASKANFFSIFSLFKTVAQHDILAAIFFNFSLLCGPLSLSLSLTSISNAKCID